MVDSVFEGTRLAFLVVTAIPRLTPLPRVGNWVETLDRSARVNPDLKEAIISMVREPNNMAMGVEIREYGLLVAVGVVGKGRKSD